MMNFGQAEPVIGVVIPVYRHPVFLAEAITSVLGQSTPPEFKVVIVNDGCPLRETSRVVQAFTETHPQKLLAIHATNSGLSAARNHGIKFLLQRFPSIEGVFLLDADNRLLPDSFRVLHAALQAFPEDDWFYPQFDMFGQSDFATNGGRWSLLMHSMDNVAEAGSLIRRRVFEAGVFYDEEMRLGYEDWEFWLAAAKAGFRGRAMRQPFLHYRKRPESMLSSSHRVDGEIRSFMRRKHAWLYNPKTAVMLEDLEASRVRVIFSDSARILALTDPGRRAQELSADDFDAEVWRWLASPEQHSAGAMWIVTSETTWALAQKLGLLRFILWELERRTADGGLCTVGLTHTDDFDYKLVSGGEAPPRESGASMVAAPHCLLRRFLSGAERPSIDSLTDSALVRTNDYFVIQSRFAAENTHDAKRNDPIRGLRQTASRFISGLRQTKRQDPGDSPIETLRNTLLRLRESPFSWIRRHDWTWRKVYCHRRESAHFVAHKCAEAAPLYPLAKNNTGTPRVCFVLPIALFGGAESVAAGVARAMRQRGWHTSLCIEGTKPIRLASPVQEAFQDIMWIAEDSLTWWKGRHDTYLGTQLPKPPDPKVTHQLLGLLGPFDTVVASHVSGTLSVLGALKKNGTVTVIHEHVVETSPRGRAHGPPMLALAHEAAADLIATCSHSLAHWLHAHGVPEEKLVPVPNAPGYDLPEPDRRDILQVRLNRRVGEPLRVLFLGRLDWQKGCDRLAAIIRRVHTLDVDVHWRVVGKAVVEESADALSDLASLVKIEDPVFTPDERTALYAWADVLVLPSRYEGLPLSVLEAKQLGVVPIMTKVGAYEEAITQGQDGILVDEDECVASMSEAVARLARDRQVLLDLSQSACATRVSWDSASAALLDKIDQLVEQRRIPWPRSRSHALALNPAGLH